MSEICFSPPDKCPSCGFLLQMEGEYLVCRNLDCPAQVTGAIKRWVKKLGILHFGDAFIEALVDSGMVVDIADLYFVDPEQTIHLYLDGRRVGTTAKKAFNNLHAKKELDLHVFLGSLGIPLFGRSMVKLLVDAGFDTLAKLWGAKIKDLEPLAGIGPIKAKAFVEGLKTKIDLVTKLLSAGITVKDKPQDGFLSGKTVCFTGFRDSQLEAKIEANGGVIKSGVSKTLDYLVCVSLSESSTKKSKAEIYNNQGARISIVDIDQFSAILPAC